MARGTPPEDSELSKRCCLSEGHGTKPPTLSGQEEQVLPLSVLGARYKKLGVCRATLHLKPVGRTLPGLLQLLLDPKVPWLMVALFRSLPLCLWGLLPGSSHITFLLSILSLCLLFSFL